MPRRTRKKEKVRRPVKRAKKKTSQTNEPEIEVLRVDDRSRIIFLKVWFARMKELIVQDPDAAILELDELDETLTKMETKS